MFAPRMNCADYGSDTCHSENQVGEPISAEEFLRNVRETQPEAYKAASDRYPVLSNPVKKRNRDLDTDFQEEVESTDAGSTRRRADRELYRQWMSEQWT